MTLNSTGGWRGEGGGGGGGRRGGGGRGLITERAAAVSGSVLRGEGRGEKTHEGVALKPGNTSVCRYVSYPGLNMHRYTGVGRCCVHRVAKLDIKAADCSLCLQELCLLWSTVCDFARGSLITEWFKALSPKPEGVGERNTLLLSFILALLIINYLYWSRNV